MAHVPVLARGVEQRLGGDAAHAQAGAAKGGLAVLAQRGVDAGDLHAQLRGADGGVVAGGAGADDDDVEVLLFAHRSEEHTSELQSLMRISYAVFCLKKKNN